MRGGSTREDRNETVVKVFFWEGGWMEGCLSLRPTDRYAEGGGGGERREKGEGVVQPLCLRCKFVPAASQAWGEGPLFSFLYIT